MSLAQYRADINARRIIGGPSDKLMCISPLKHTWAREMWRVMAMNTWFPAEVDMARDVKAYKTLNPKEKRAYDMALAFLSNLDGIQFNNLVFNIGEHITSPEVSMCISRQAYEEANHVDSYATLIEAVTDEPLEIYTLFKRDAVLGEKNEFIIKQSEILGKEFSPRNFALAVIANIILEGVYFYSGFLVFYCLSRDGKMHSSADMIRFIQRDELTHMQLFMHILRAMQQENPEVFDDTFWADVRALFRAAVGLESAWGKHLVQGGAFGLTDAIIEQYIQWLADSRLAMIGLAPEFGVKNPVPWVEDFSRINGEQANFFEGRVKSYAVGGSLDWE
ncbi:ribonucleotide-diphosphate reductase subunit beta [Methylobacillus sp.]|uniref:ribonucleotide-diphosphate reductase subunit beta n=1 Tax=Methylobacillus sp. TaxID=56818 RepID=UPI0012CC39DB|nr:ribonucleotide-diphosphate reductase subunit beta [Methylobacillus sp.]MPS48486.1 ribonucleotide-diphosphate reductase subunit beta [Methylobacillus sp.]